MKKLVSLSALLFLAACATPEQIAEQKRLQAEQDSNTCRSYGLRPGSEAFGNCRLQIDLARQQQYNYDYSYPRYYGPPHIGTSIYYMRH